MRCIPGLLKFVFDPSTRRFAPAQDEGAGPKILGFRQEAFALGAFTGQFPRAADSFGLLARLALRGLLEMVAALHLPEETFALHLLLQRFQRLIDVVVADHDLNDVKLSIRFARPAAGLVDTQKRRKDPDSSG